MDKGEGTWPLPPNVGMLEEWVEAHEKRIMELERRVGQLAANSAKHSVTLKEMGHNDRKMRKLW